MSNMDSPGSGSSDEDLLGYGNAIHRVNLLESSDILGNFRVSINDPTRVHTYGKDSYDSPDYREYTSTPKPIPGSKNRERLQERPYSHSLPPSATYIPHERMRKLNGQDVAPPRVPNHSPINIPHRSPNTNMPTLSLPNFPNITKRSQSAVPSKSK